MKPRPLQRDPETGTLLVVLTKGAFALISEEDAEWVGRYNWAISNKGYATRGVSNGKKLFRLHREIVEHMSGTPIPEAGQVDHINGNRLDCRRHNLRVCTARENGKNRGANSNNRSGIKGVSLTKQGYKARIGVHGRDVYLGRHQTAQAAAEAYEAAAIKYFGEFKRPKDKY